MAVQNRSENTILHIYNYYHSVIRQVNYNLSQHFVKKVKLKKHAFDSYRQTRYDIKLYVTTVTVNFNELINPFRFEAFHSSF